MSIRQIDPSLQLPEPEIYLATPSRVIIGKLDKHIYNVERITKLRDISQISFNIPIELDIDNQLTSHPLLSRVKQNYTLKLNYNGEIEWYKILKITQSSDDSKNEYVVQALSLATELNQKKIIDLDVSSYNCTQIMNVALTGTKWTIGTIDPSYNLGFRDFQVTTKTSLEFILNDIVPTFVGSLAQFDTVNRTVSIVQESSLDVDFGLRIRYEHYMTGVNQEMNGDTLCTRLYCVGKDSLTINRTNPNGLSYVDDFSYYLAPYQTDANGNVLFSSDYFSDGLSQAVVNYTNLLKTKSPISANAGIGTTETTLIITSHGLATGDYIVNRTHNRETRSVTVVDANTLTLSSAVTGQTAGDEIEKYPDGTFGKLLFQLESLQSTLQTQQNDMDTLKTQKLTILDQLAIQTKANTIDSYIGVISNSSVTRTLSGLATADDYIGMCYVSDTASTSVTLNGSTKAMTANTWTVLGKMTGSTSYNIGVTTTTSNVVVKTMIIKITNAEYVATGNEITLIETYNDDNKQNEINAKQSNIDSTNTSITSKNTDITNMRNTLGYSANFTTDQLNELTDYIYEDEYNNENIVDDKDLYDFGVQELSKRNTPSILYKTNVVDFLQSITEQFNWNKLVLGSTVTIIHPKLNINAKAKILEIDHNFETAEINLTIGDNKEVLSKKDRVLKQLYKSMYSNKELLKKKQTWDITQLNFSNRNDRISATPNDPTLATDGTAIDHVVNSNGSVDITFEWRYNDYNTTHADADNIDGFFVYIYASDKSSRYVIGSTNDNIDIRTMKPQDRYVVLMGVAANKYYTFGVQAYRIVDQDVATDGVLKSNTIQSSYNGENPYQPLTNPAYTGDWQGTLNNVAVATVVTNAGNGQTTYTQTSNSIRNGNVVPDPSSSVVLSYSTNTDGSANVNVSWTYTESSTSPIDGFGILYYSNMTNTVHTLSLLSDTTITVDKGTRTFLFHGVPINRFYTIGVYAYRTVDTTINSAGIIRSNIITSSQSPYQASASVSFTGDANGTVAGTSAGTVVTNAGNGNTAYSGTTTYRDTTAPNGVFTCNNLSSVTNTDGSIDITLTWSFVQGTVRADGYVVVYENGQNVVPVVGSHSYFQDSTTTKMIMSGVSANTYHNFKIYAYRTTNAGLVTSTLTNAANWINYQASTTPNYTGNVGGSSASTIAYNSTNNNINLLQNGGAEIYTGRSGTNIPDNWSTWQPSTLCAFTRRVNDASWTISGNATFEINYVGTATTNTNGAYLQDYTKVNAGETYTFSCLLEAHRCGGYIRFEYYDVNGAMLGSDNSTSISNISTPTSMILTKTLPANCVKLRCLLWKDIQLAGQTSSYLFADNVKLEKGGQATPYVEVDLGSSGTINNGIQQAINYNNVQINNIDGLKVSHTDGTNTIVNGSGVVVNGGNITIYDNNGRIVMDGRGLNPLENTGWGVTTGLTFSIASFTKAAYIETVYTGATQSITAGTTLQLNSVTGLGTTTGTIYVAGTFGFNFNYDTVNATSNTIRVSAIGSGWGTSDNLYNNSILWASIVNGVSQPSPSGTLSLTVKAGSAVLKSGKYVNIATDQTMSVPISVGLTDFDGWEYRVVYLDSNGNLQYMSSGTSGGVYNQWALDTYPDNPRVSTDANAVILGCILCGASSYTSGSGFNGYVILHPDFRDERAVKVYDKTVSGGEYKTNGVKSTLSTSTTSYGSNEYSAISLNATQTYKISIDVGQGKRFAIVALSSASGNTDTYATIPNNSTTVYQDDNPNYGAVVFAGLRNPYTGANQPRWAIGYNNYFVEDRYTDANGQYLVHESSMGWTNRRVQDAWLEIGTDGETYLNIVLYQYSITESRNIRVNWTVM